MITFMMRILGYACFECSMHMPESCKSFGIKKLVSAYNGQPCGYQRI